MNLFLDGFDFKYLRGVVQVFQVMDHDVCQFVPVGGFVSFGKMWQNLQNISASYDLSVASFNKEVGKVVSCSDFYSLLKRRISVQQFFEMSGRFFAALGAFFVVLNQLGQDRGYFNV